MTGLCPPADHRTAETMRARALEAERLLSEATARAERAEAECERLVDVVLTLRATVERLREATPTCATCVAPGSLLSERDALRAKVETLTRERVVEAQARDTFGESLEAALGEHATGDTAADVRRVVERAEIAAVNEAGSADVNAVLLERIGATHLDEACEVLWRDREERDRLRGYLARALRGCDARERVAIEADMAREASDGGE